MKKIIKLVGIILAAAALLGLAGCPQVPEHEHTFAEEWTSDATHHWHAATCEHADEVDGRAVHEWNEGAVTKTASCAEAGAKLFTCKVCHAEKTEEIAKLPHTWDEGEVTKEPSLAAEGVKTYTCTECGGTKTESIERLPYNWYESPVDAETGLAATESSTYVYFGVFPKTVLPETSDVTVDDNEKVEMGANTYYRGSDGEYYAKVLENAYGSSDVYKYTDGVQAKAKTKESYRYFKVEPIKWRVLTKDYDGKMNALLLAEDILTADVPYYEDKDLERTIDGKTVYASNYMHSQIRAYLNGIVYQDQSGEAAKWNGNGFLQTAFTTTAQERIATTNVDNSPASTTDAGKYISQATKYACENTNDKIFLLSEKEVTTAAYGFDAYNKYGENNARIRVPTDYAKANFGFQSIRAGEGGNWWLRSPYYSRSDIASIVCSDGDPKDPRDLNSSFYGIVPALTMSLN